VAAGAFVLLALLCWLCFFNGIDLLAPLDKTEALQLEIARSMAVSGDWVTPATGGLPYFDKPPLPYWIGAVLLRLAPQEAWLPRLGAATAGCIGLSATLVLCRFGCSDGASRRGLSRAVSAAAILGLMPAYAGFSRIALHDIYLTASITTTLTIVFLLSQHGDPSPRRQALAGWLSGLALGLGVLAKGLLSLALPFATASVFLAVAGPAARRPFSRRFAAALLLGLLLVALPWHLEAWHDQGNAFLANYLGRSHLNRFTSELDDHAGPWFYYLLAYPGLTAPWSLPALAALIQGDALHPGHWRRRLQSEPLLVLCTIWIAVTVGLLSLASTKLPHYILSGLPPTAIAAAHFFWPSRQPQPSSDRPCRILLGATATVLLAAALLLGWMPSLLIPTSRNAPAFSLALRALLGSPAMLAGLVLLGVCGGWVAWRGRRPRLGLGALLAACVIGLLLLAPPVMQAYRVTVQEPRLALADRALREARGDEPIQVVGKSWYSVRIHTHGRAEILHRGKAFSRGGAMPSAAACAGPRLLLGPSDSVRRAADSCGSSSLVVLEQDPQARITLARLHSTGD
jgi:4-amino-4-deoxy-L-arabinose transferase-like glycosyltransferase